jgi:hypothetical protein
MKQQKQLILLGLLLLAGIGIWYWDGRQGPLRTGARDVMASYTPMSVEGLTIQSWKIEKVRKTDYKGGNRNPFIPLAPPPPAPKVPQPGDKDYVEPTPPPPPPLELPPPYKFFGYGTVPNGTARRAFLSDGEEVQIVGEGDVFLGRFRILKIGNATIEFEEISSGRQGKANMEDAGPTA